MPAARPVDPSELAHQLSGITRAAVAVSGGPDSMALLLLLKDHPGIEAITIDHALREGSASEAQQVARWCEALGVRHTIIQWKHRAITSSFQEQARDARYELLLAHCRAHGIGHLFTAHHQDDQAETFLFRLARGSGMEGLAGILPISHRHGIFIHRPLLAFSKERLIATLNGHPCINDPSNDDPRHTRVRIRQMDLPKEHISALTFSFQKIRAALEKKMLEALQECTSFHPAGFARIDMEPFRNAPPELQSRMLSHITMRISGNAEPIRSEKLARLTRHILTPAPGKKITIHGVLYQFISRQNTWLALREIARTQAPMALSEHPQLWDGRFLLPIGNPQKTVGPLGPRAQGLAGPLEKAGIPKAAWPTVPAFFRLETPVCVPHIHWGTTSGHNLRSIHAKLLAGECGNVDNGYSKFSDGVMADAKYG